MQRISISRIGEWGVLALLVLSVLWRGGKGLELTWLAAAVAGLITLVYGTKRLLGLPTADPDSQQSSSRNMEMPVLLTGMVYVLIFLTIVSYLHSSTSNYGLDAVLRTVSFLLIFFWTARLSLDGKRNRFLALTVRLVTWAAVIAAFVGVLVYVLQPVNRFVGTFFDFRFDTDYWPNAWAEFVVLAWPLMLIHRMRSTNAQTGRWMFAGMGIVLGSLLLSYSRGGILVLLIQIGLMTLLLAGLALRDIRYRRIFSAARQSAVIRTIATVLIAGAFFLGVNAVRAHFHDVQSVAEKVTFTASEGTSSISERSQFWHQAFRLSQNHPWLGYGPYSFRFVQPQLAEGILATSDHAHNVILNTALERGWPTTVLSVLIVLFVLIGSLRLLFTRKREWSPEKDLTTVLLLTAVIGVYIHNMIDFNLQFVGISLPLWLCLGFLVVPPASDMRAALGSFSRWKFSQYFFRLKVLVAFLLLIVTAAEGGELIVSSLGRHAQARGKTEEALQWYRRARYQWFSRDMHLSEAELFLRKNDAPAALTAVDTYMEQNAIDPRGWKIRGMILLRMQKFPEAEAALSTAYDLSKNTDLGILDLLLQTAHDDTARQRLLSRKLEFDALFSAYADAIERNVHFIALSTNVESLQSVARQLAQLFPIDEKSYKVIARRASAHAQEERLRFTARSQGLLW